MTLWRDRLTSVRRIGFDTNVLIYALEGSTRYAQLMADILAMMQQGELYGVVSTIVEVELLVRPLRERSQTALDQVELLLQKTPNLFIRPVDRAIARRAADVRARTGLRIPDAIIVATAVEEHCQAIIGNDATMARRVTEMPYLYLEDYVS